MLEEIEINAETETSIIKPKRGRKTKKEKEEKEEKEKEENNKLSLIQNIEFKIQDKDKENKIVPLNEILNKSSDKSTNEILITETIVKQNDSTIITNKKRGRKPKGGKIINNVNLANNDGNKKQNVILHLKCYLKFLEINAINSFDNVEPYGSFSSYCPTTENVNYNDTNNNKYTLFDVEKEKYLNDKYKSTNFKNTTQINETLDTLAENEEKHYDEHSSFGLFNGTKIQTKNENKEIHKKLKQLEINLHQNAICDKKSACFWCTYDFDNTPIYIPKFFLKEKYHVYGSFCSPECAVAYLMEENIDSSTKFERFHLLNHVYSKIFNYEKSIKPAPNPYYMLNKYYGNLTIQEYRSLLKSERLFFLVDKPLTRILPELHEDNDEFVINKNQIIPSNNTIQNKKKLLKKTHNETSNFLGNEIFR